MLVGQGEILTQLEGQLFPNTGPGYAEAISQEKKVLLAEVMVIKEEKNILFGEKNGHCHYHTHCTGVETEAQNGLYGLDHTVGKVAIPRPKPISLPLTHGSPRFRAGLLHTWISLSLSHFL